MKYLIVFAQFNDGGCTIVRQKRCPICESDKNITEFGRNRQSVDGLHYYCRSCSSAKQRAWAKANTEKVAAARRKYLDRVRATNELRVSPYE
jgi:hypothetical protein